MRIGARVPGMPPGFRIGGEFSWDSLKFRRTGVAHAAALWGLAVCVVLLVLFAFVANYALANGGRNEFDDRVAEAMRDASPERPGLRNAMVLATFLGGVPFLGAVAAIGAVWLWWARQREMTVLWCCIALGGGGLNQGLKVAFGRERPPHEWRDPHVHEENKSFPSGHSMGSIIAYGMLGYIALMRRRERWRTVLVLTILVILVPVVGFSRIFLRAHWVTDVVGGFLVGGAWLALSLGILEDWRRQAIYASNTT